MALDPQTTNLDGREGLSHRLARRTRLRAVLLTGAGLFALSGVFLWTGETGTEAATPSGRSEARLGSDILPTDFVPNGLPAIETSLSARTVPQPDAVSVEPERIVLASAETSDSSEPVVGAWRSTSMAEPEAVTAPGPKVAYTVAALGDPAVVAPADALPVIPAVPRRPLVKAHSEEFSRILLGKWVPNRDVCTDPEASEFLPLEISSTKAVAGAGECTFESKRKVGGGWNVVAQCSDGAAIWTSNVSIEVAKNRLTWASERGTQTYERCDSGAARIASRSSSGKANRVAARKKPAVVAARRATAKPRA